MNRTLVVTRRKQETSQTSWIALAGPQQGPGEALRAEKKKEQQKGSAGALDNRRRNGSSASKGC